MTVDPGLMDVAGVAWIGLSGYNIVKNLGRKLENKTASYASRQPSIYDPKPTPQRPFADDYISQTVGSDGRLARDIEGRELGATFVAGRQRQGMADVPLSEGNLRAIAELLRIPRHTASRSSKDGLNKSR
ncbi:MAG: hypothetical protein ACK5JE_04670 [Castellaniella sp.]|uniref:hypothetical protein n=1 Tax=Castellaniella sp. TaxID=1955812 RepID=UPI003A8C28DF